MPSSVGANISRGLVLEETDDESTLKFVILKFPGSKTDVAVGGLTLISVSASMTLAIVAL